MSASKLLDMGEPCRSRPMPFFSQPPLQRSPERGVLLAGSEECRLTEDRPADAFVDVREVPGVDPRLEGHIEGIRILTNGGEEPCFSEIRHPLPPHVNKDRVLP